LFLGSWFNSGHQRALSHRAPPTGTNGRVARCRNSRPPISPSPCSAGYPGRSREWLRPRHVRSEPLHVAPDCWGIAAARKKQRPPKAESGAGEPRNQGRGSCVIGNGHSFVLRACGRLWRGALSPSDVIGTHCRVKRGPAFSLAPEVVGARTNGLEPIPQTRIGDARGGLGTLHPASRPRCMTTAPWPRQQKAGPFFGSQSRGSSRPITRPSTWHHGSLASLTSRRARRWSSAGQ
jgi:hypothetical protein